MDYDRYGRIRIYSAFIPEYTVSANGEEYYSNVENVLADTEKIHYASYSQDFWKADGSMCFIPRNEV